MYSTTCGTERLRSPRTRSYALADFRLSDRGFPVRFIRSSFLLLVACLGAAAAFAASSPTSPPAAPVQPALAPLLTARAAELNAVGIQRIVARPGKQILDIQVLTAYGPIYF